MLEAINLGCVRGDRRLFRQIQFTLTEGSFLQIQGPNGSGKTSLLRIICGLLAPAEGEVRWCGENIRTLGEDYFGAIAYIAHQNGVKDELTPLENLRISAGVTGSGLSQRNALVILERVGLEQQRYLATRLLSAGQRRRLALARLLASKARLWILDEVLTSLDDHGVELTQELLVGQLAKGGLAIVASHQELNLSTGSIQRIRLAS